MKFKQTLLDGGTGRLQDCTRACLSPGTGCWLAVPGSLLAAKQITLQIDNIYIAMAMALQRRWWQEKLASNISR